MNAPTMTNEQFALWYAPAYPGKGTILEKAEIILDWLDKKSKKSEKPITPKAK